MKYHLHAFEEVRRTFEVEANSIEEAAAMLDAAIQNQDPIASELTGDFDVDFCVDPILPDGEVDYDNSKWFPEEQEA